MSDQAEIDWASLEDHVVDGVFLPPIKVGSVALNNSARSQRHIPNRELRDEVVSSSLFRYNAASRTYETTIVRLRAHVFNTLITLHDAASGDLIQFKLALVTRGRSDWISMTFQATSEKYRGIRLVVLNAGAPNNAVDDREIRVFRDGLRWLAEFRWSEQNMQQVRAAGFRFDSVEKLWHTRDPKIAAKFDTELRIQLEVQEKHLRDTSKTMPRLSSTFSLRKSSANYRTRPKTKTKP